MKRRPISWILEFVSNLPNEEEKIKCLRANGVEPIKVILRFCFASNIEWLLPEGEPPYVPTEQADENALYKEARRLYLFVKGGNDNLNDNKRQMLFLDLIQGILPEDAKLIVSIKDKKMPYPGITAELVDKAFPGLM